VLGCIEAPTGEEEIGPAAFRVSGWAHARRGAVSRVDIWLDREWLGRAALGRPRPDVADALGDPAALLSGFELSTPLPARPRSPLAHLGATVTLLDGTRESWAASPLRFKAPPPWVPTPVMGSRFPGRPAGPVRGLRVARARGTVRALWVARALDLGGSQLRMAELIRHARATAGFEVTVLSDTDGPLRDVLQDAGASVQIAPRPPLDDLGAYERALEDWTAAFAGRFDLVVGATVTSFPAVELARRLGLPSVLRLGESAPLSTVVGWLYGQLDPAIEDRARQAFADAYAVASNSHAAVDTYCSHGFGGRYTVLSTGVDVKGADQFLAASDRVECRAQLGIDEDARLMVCVASLWKVKGQAVLVRALAHLAACCPNLTLALVGHAPDAQYKDALATICAEAGLGDRVRCVPFLEDLRPWWRAADVAVCPSESEALPAVVLEAMSFGLPVLGCDVGDLPRVVRSGVNGWLCHHSDLGAMIAGLRRVADASPATLQAMGAAARVQARKHDRDACLARWTKLLARAAVGRPRRPGVTPLAG
jgi:D-inositol-3-phosphate glycosyltransferase